MTVLFTERLVLRPATPADLEPIHAILCDPIAMAFWSSPPHKTLEQTRTWLDAMIAIEPDEGEDFIVEHDGRAIGKAGLFRFPEVGYILRPDAWGRGFASEALRRVIDHGFDAHGLARIEADVDPRNERSLRLLDRLGFLETGRKAHTWRIGETWCDSIYLRLDATAWRERLGRKIT